MKFFNFRKRSSTPKARPANPAVILPLESRQLLSVAAAPDFSVPAGPGIPNHVEAFASEAAGPADLRPGPAFGQTDAPSMPVFAFGFMGAGMPLGIVGGNLLRLHEPPVFDFDANPLASGVANGPASNVQLNAAIPSAISSEVNSDADSAIASTTSSTPGSGLAFLVQQAAGPAMAMMANTSAVSSALTGLTELSNASALAA